MTITIKFLDELIEKAKVQPDASLYVYMVRDTPEVEAAELKDLAWAFHNGSPCRSECIWFLEELKNYILNQKPTQ